MKWFARAVAVVLAAASSGARAAPSDPAGPVCDLDCRTPSVACPDQGTNNTFCANAWNSDGEGFQCLQVGQDFSSFVATSHWTSLPVHIVHSYPHVKLGSPLLPLPFHDISSLRVNVEWGMFIGGDLLEYPTNRTLGVDSVALTESATVGNVAFDIWADLDPVKSSNESFARIEIMIWLGSFGTIQPLGWDNKNGRARAKLGETTFTLYTGEGPAGQSAFTWIPDTNVTRFSQDLSPLVQYLWRNNLVPSEAYVGTVGFGSEQFFSLNPVAFSSEQLTLNITSSGPLPDLTCNAATGTFRPPSMLGFAAFAIPLFILSLF